MTFPRLRHRHRIGRVIGAAMVLGSVCAPMVMGVGTAHASSHTLIEGSGSSWAANAVNQWVSDVTSQGIQVVYNPAGDATGRQDYANKTSDFAVTALGYQGVDPVTGVPDTSQGRPYAYLPIAAGGTAFPYQIKIHGVQTRNLRLSGETLTKIFTNVITNWDNPEITQDNNGHALPSLPIIPVVQSEGSGATAQLTRYFATEDASLWKAYNGGSDSLVEYWNRKGAQVAQNGSDGAMNYVSSSSANGSIGYVEYSYALSQGYPVVKMLNSAGYYELPTQYNVAVALEKAQINEHKNSPDYLLQNLNNVYTDPDPRTYPLSSYVYMIEPTGTNSQDSKLTTAKRQTIADFAYYSICQGQKEIGPIGYSPLPVNLVEAGFGQIAKLKTADSGVDLANRNITTCNNPTFVEGHPSSNYLATIAPLPLACDKSGAGPCADGVTPIGNNTPTPSTSHKSSPSGNSKTNAPGANPSPTPGTNPTGGSGPNKVTTLPTGGTHTNSFGQVVPNDTSSAAAAGAASGADQQADAQLAPPAALDGYRAGHSTKYLAPLAVVLLILALVLPPVVAYYMAAKRRSSR
jgi:phosphate transport system substrate-binding protein